MFLATKVYTEGVCWGFWLGSVQNRSCFPTLCLISRSVWFHISRHCDWWSSSKYQQTVFMFCVNLSRVLLNGICFNTPELLNKFIKSGFICSVSWHMENKFLLLTCGLLSGGCYTILIFNGEGPTQFSCYTKRLIMIASYNMCKVGECECVNTEEGADFAVGNIWEMYGAQTAEGIK